MSSPPRSRARTDSSAFDQVKAALLRRLLGQRRPQPRSYLLDVLPAGGFPLGPIPAQVDTQTMVPTRHLTATGILVHLPADGASPDAGAERFQEVGSSSSAAVAPSPAPSEAKTLTVEPSGSNTRPRKRARTQSASPLPPSDLVTPSGEVSKSEDRKPAPKRPGEYDDLDSKPASSSRRKRVRRESIPNIPRTRSSTATKTPSRSVSERLPLRSSPRIRRKSESNLPSASTQLTAERKTRAKRQNQR